MTAQPNVHARVTHRFTASAERVFDAWLDPEKVSRWMLSGGGELVRVNVDPRIGGSFSFVVRRGEHVIDHIGEYLEIDRPRRLVFTWGIAGESTGDSRVVINIMPMETGCELTLDHEMDPQWADYVARTETGWTKIIGAIAGAVE